MDFPTYVPPAVQKHIAHYLDGESDRGIPGYFELLNNASNDLARIDRAIESKIRRGEEEYLPSLRSQRADAVEQHGRLDRDVKRLQLLARDRRMREAFAGLKGEAFSDEQWRAFVHSAWSAGIDFSVFRERRRRAKDLAAKIAAAAADLAELIHQFSANGFSGPGEFYSIPELLRQTDNHDMRDHNLHMWKAMRRHILGEPPRHSEAGGIERSQERNMLVYAWGTSPDFAALLRTVTVAAKTYEPDQSGFIGAALNSRKGTPKTAYIRAFATLLRDRGITLTARVKSAMAITATVVLNDLDDPVTTADVNSAVKTVG